MSSYIEELEVSAKDLASKCFSGETTWRDHLQDLYTPFGKKKARDRCDCWNKPAACGKCVPCTRCGMRYDPLDTLSIHGSAGDYENFPEIYIAKVLHKPWYDHTKIQYRPYMHDLIGKDANGRSSVMLMTEDEILAGLAAVLERWPRIIGCVHYLSLYVAIIARMPRVISVLTDWMERRNWWYTPSGDFAKLSRVYEPYTCPYELTRLDWPRVIREGPHNPPVYFQSSDWSESTMNTCHAIEDWVQGRRDGSGVDTQTLHILGRALAANDGQWEAICCASMNGYQVIKPFVGCISHCIEVSDSTGETIQRDVTPNPNRWLNNASTTTSSNAKIIWHTIRSRCAYCVTETHSDHHPEYCAKCIPAAITERVPIEPYEIVIAHAVTVRRRRFRGLLWCAAVLAGRARLMHFRPGVGKYFKEGSERFYRGVENCEKV
jgi:hypothetical protein